MNLALSDAIKEAFAIAPASVVTLNTLEFRQTGVQDSIYIVQARRPWVAQDEHGVERTFVPAGFQFTLPPATEDGFQNLNIAVDNIGQTAIDFIKTALAYEVPVEVYYRPYLSTDTTTPQMIPPLVLYLKDVDVDVMQITGRATFMDIVNKHFPLELYTRERFPTL